MNSTSSARAATIHYALYEAPGPKTHRRTIIGTAISAVLVVIAIALIIRQFYITGQLAPRYWYFFGQLSTWRFLFQGFRGTVVSALAAGIGALAVGLLLMLGRVSVYRPLSAVCRVVTDFLRGIPSLLLIYFFFLVVPQYGIKLSSFAMITLPVMLTASGVLAEIMRAGVNAVPKGQVEAAMALGMRRARIMWKIVLPQALRYVIPSMVAQLVIVVKDTTLGYVVSYADLMQNTRVLITNYDALVSMYFVVAIIYVLLNFAINQAANLIAKRMDVKVIR